MEKSTKIIIAVLVIALIILGIVISVNKNKAVQTDNKNTINQSNEVKDAVNWIKNEVNDVQNNIENTISENNVENIIDNAQDNSNNSIKENETSNKEEDNNQKAIDMVKSDWGEDDSVNFKIDEQSEDGKYVISVVDKNTTKVLVWYDVDIKNNTIQER